MEVLAENTAFSGGRGSRARHRDSISSGTGESFDDTIASMKNTYISALQKRSNSPRRPRILSKDPSGLRSIARSTTMEIMEVIRRFPYRGIETSGEADSIIVT